MTSCKRSGPIQVMLNIIKHLDPKVFDKYLITIYKEQLEISQLKQFKQYVKHYFVPTNKIHILLNDSLDLKKTLKRIKPNVIHSLGVFPDFAVSRMKEFKQLITVHNYVFDDYPAKFGIILGNIMAYMHLYAMKHDDITITCSESLSKIYNDKLNLQFDFIRNGVDLEHYRIATENERISLRKELNIPIDSFVFVYTGQLIERKNMDFMLSAFSEAFSSKNVYLLVVGGGAKKEELMSKYGHISNIDFRGNVNDVSQFLKASDAYVSASRSEGLPNGVLEAMATGLPVVLSDIDQHLEIFSPNPKIGKHFRLADKQDCIGKMKELVSSDYKSMGKEAYYSANENFSAKKMSEAYQKLYRQLTAK